MMFDSVQELINDFQPGRELEFYHNAIAYGLGWTDSGPHAYRQDAFGFYEQEFGSMEELLDGFVIEGKPLRLIATELTNITLY